MKSISFRCLKIQVYIKNFLFYGYTMCAAPENRIWIKTNKIKGHEKSGISIEVKTMDIFDLTSGLDVSNEDVNKIKKTGIGVVPSAVFSFDGGNSVEYRLWKYRKINYVTPRKVFTITVLEIIRGEDKIEYIQLQID